jgi:hypothetical protein
MFASLLLTAAVLAPQEADLATFRDRGLGLAFQHPKTWTVKRERLFTTFEIPLPGGATAQAQLFGAVFRDPAETWQGLQAEVSKAQGRTVERQWQEELLGVPMLLTKVSHTEQERPFVTLIGLLYSATPEKMQFRLLSPGPEADAAQAAWWAAMLTLRTTSGNLPGEEDPTKPLEDLVPEAPQPEVVLRKPLSDSPAVRPGVAVPFGEMNLELPAPWALGEGGRLTREGLQGTVTVEVGSGDGEAAGKALETAVAESLRRFDKVELRKDTIARPARTGALVASVWRRGTAVSGGALVSGQWAGLCGSRYWIVRYSGGGLASWDQDKRALTELVEGLYVVDGP